MEKKVKKNFFFLKDSLLQLENWFCSLTLFHRLSFQTVLYRQYSGCLFVSSDKIFFGRHLSSMSTFFSNVSSECKFLLKVTLPFFKKSIFFLSVSMESNIYFFVSAVALRYSVFHEISHKSQESTWARVSFLKKLQA